MTYLFIDGSNLYASQYDLVGPKRFIHFPTLIANLEKKLHIHLVPQIQQRNKKII